MAVHVEVTSKPVIGILTMGDENQQFRGNKKNFLDIIKMGREKNIDVFVVTVDDLNLNSESIKGFRYDFAGRRWVQEWVPLPDVLYNRIPYREDEMLPKVKETIRKCLKHPHIQLYNPAFFNKWHLFEWLKKSKATKMYIPMTRKLTKKLKLKSLLKRHKILYLKPVKGKAGKGIMRVSLVNAKKFPYQLSIQEKQSSANHKYAAIAQLKRHIHSYIGSEKYIVQKGIQLASYNGRPFDLRILIQKNRSGKWQVSGIGGRLAGDLSITTHVPRGGAIFNPEQLLSANFGKNGYARMIRRVGKAALDIAKQIEKSSGYLLGEMSMDIGIDTKHRIWFFEANAKPMKFDEPHIRQKSLELFFEYCTYLANKNKSPKRRSEFVY
jgi:hypothetical protein